MIFAAVIAVAAVLGWLASPNRHQNRAARHHRAAMCHEVPAEEPCMNCGCEVILVNRGNAEAFATHGELPESYDYRCFRCNLNGQRFIM